MFEVIVRGTFSSAHALRHYHGRTEPLHGHNFVVEVVVRGKRLQNKVKYLSDFIALERALHTIIKPMDHINLNDYPPFTKENPSAENIAEFIGRQMTQRWREKGVSLASVTVWETESMGARYFPQK
jgi:6-pyruvoyltetrahydropterin/6-carboxytetrahydropterin synthase